PAPSGARWVLQSATVEPKTPGHGWTYSAGSTSATFKLDNGQASQFNWNAPPQTVGPQGFPVSITASSPYYETSINAAGSGIPGNSIGMEAGPVHKPTTQTKQVTFTPSAGDSSFELAISLGYGAVTF